jgi:pimeloyl-ACP methyl ester carboxylesterase
MAQERSFDASVVKLNYLEYDSPCPKPLVMLHGGAWRWQEYLSLIPNLAFHRHVYAIDFRGNGRSGWASGSYRLQDFTQDIVEFLDHLSASSAVIAGHSLGGSVALMAAAQRPDKVAGLIIEDAPLNLDTYRQVIDTSRDMYGQWLSLKRAATSAQDLALTLADAYRDYPRLTSQWILFFADCLWQLDPAFFDPLLGDFDGFARGYDPDSILLQLKCPLLFLHGEPRLGAIATANETAWLQRNVPASRCALIEGVGHLLHLEDHGQTQVLAEMIGFLEKLQTLN